MLIEKFQTAMDRIQALPPEQQEALAEQIEDLLDVALWDAQFADLDSEPFFDELVADALHRRP
jgi:hypothetical protein